MASRHGKLPSPYEQALLTTGEELGHSAWLFSGTSLASVSQKEITLNQEAPLPKEGFISKQSSRNTS